MTATSYSHLRPYRDRADHSPGANRPWMVSKSGAILPGGGA